MESVDKSEHNKKVQVKQIYNEFAEQYEQVFTTGRLRFLKELNFYIIDSILKKDNIHKILDAGGATGYLTEHLVKEGHDVTIIDISEQMIEMARKNAFENLKGYEEHVHFLVGDLENAKEIQDESFDFILYDGGTLSYLSNPAAGLKEVCRMLKRNGLALITAQNKYHFMGLVNSINISNFIYTRSKVPAYLNDVNVVTTCFAPCELKKMISDSGLQVEQFGSKPVTIEKMSFVTDEILDNNEEVFSRILKLEKELLWETSLSGVGRTLMALCRKK